MKTTLLLTCFALFMSAGLRAAEEPKGIPYNSVNLSMKVLDGLKIDGVECVPFYVRTEKGRPPLVPGEADFRIVTWEGETVRLKCEPLDKIPPEELPEIHEKMVKDGYTHVLWMPKGVKKYLDGSILHSLPKGAVVMSQGVAWKGKISLKP